MPKTKAKPKKAAAIKRHPRIPAKKKARPRMREAVHAKPTKKARPAMPTPTTKADASKSKSEPEEMSPAERRKYLLEEAEKNEKFNDELTTMQHNFNKKAQQLFEDAAAETSDPDALRESAINGFRQQQDPDERKKSAEAAQSSKPKYTPSPTTPDFKAGQASG
jgi:hypothetical protein